MNAGVESAIPNPGPGIIVVIPSSILRWRTPRNRGDGDVRNGSDKHILDSENGNIAGQISETFLKMTRQPKVTSSLMRLSVEVGFRGILDRQIDNRTKTVVCPECDNKIFNARSCTIVRDAKGQLSVPALTQAWQA